MRGITSRMYEMAGYVVATVVTAGLSFLTTPVLTRLVGVSGYGKWSLLEPSAFIVGQISILGVNYGIFRHVSLHKRSPVRMYCLLSLASKPLTIVLAAMIAVYLAGVYTSGSEAGWYAFLAIAEGELILAFSTFRAAQKVVPFAASSITRSGLFFAAIAWAAFSGVAVSVKGVVAAKVIASTAALALGLLIFYRTVKAPVQIPMSDTSETSWKRYAEAVSYGLPLMVMNLLVLVIEFADRFIVKHWTDFATLGTYVVYVKVSAILTSLVIVPFGLWWPAERFKRMTEQDGGRIFFRQTAVVVLSILLLLGGLLWLLSAHIVAAFSPGTDCDPLLMLFLVSSVVFIGMGAPLNVGLLNEGRTHSNIYAGIIGATFHIVLCLLLIPPFRITGAAAATAVSYLIYTSVLNVMSQRVYPVPFAYITMVFLAFAALVAGYVAQLGSFGIGVVDAVLKSGKFLAVFSPACLIALRRERILPPLSSLLWWRMAKRLP